MEIKLTEQSIKDLAELPAEVEDTFFNAKDTAESNITDLGATPRQAFEKYLSGDMHPFLQEKFGDYRAWFVEGDRVNLLENGKIYCIRILTAKEAHRIEDSTKTFSDILQSALG